MNGRSRPVIAAWLVNRENGCYLESVRKRIQINGDSFNFAVYLLREARGRKSITQLATAEYDEKRILAFLNQLEELGVAYDAHLLAQYGQLVASYPDPLRFYPGDAAAIQLMELPPDRDGDFIPVDNLNQISLVDGRHTTRLFTGASIKRKEVERIGFSAYGITENLAAFNRRTVPSAGAIYPLQVDYIVISAEDMKVGLYRWAKRRNGFIYYDNPSDPELIECFLDQDWIGASLIQVISYDIGRSAAKYSSRAHRFALLEAGHVAQNSILEAVRLGLGAWEYGGYLDEKLANLLEVNKATGGIATVLFYGRPA